MNVELTTEQQAFVRQGMESGRYSKEELTQLAEDIKRRGLARLASNETKLINGAIFRFFRSLPARNREPQIGRREISRFPSGASRSRIHVSNDF